MNATRINRYMIKITHNLEEPLKSEFISKVRNLKNVIAVTEISGAIVFMHKRCSTHKKDELEGLINEYSNQAIDQ